MFTNRHSIFGLAASGDCVCPPGYQPWPTMSGNTVCKDPKNPSRTAHIPCGSTTAPTGPEYQACPACLKIAGLGMGGTVLKGNPDAEFCMGCLARAGLVNSPLYTILDAAGVS